MLLQHVRACPSIRCSGFRRWAWRDSAWCLALIGLIMFLPPVRDRVQDIYWFSAKVAGFMYLYIWYRGTFPRYRFDQLMKVGWKVLLPMGIGVLILTGVVGMRTEVWAAADSASEFWITLGTDES